MTYEEIEDQAHGTHKAIITFNFFDMMNCRLDPWDRRLLEECKKSEKISDKLLALQTIAFRLEQAQKK